MTDGDGDSQLPAGADQTATSKPSDPNIIVASTSDADAKEMPSAPSDSVTTREVDSLRVVVEARHRTIYRGPLPDPGTLREYGEIYPGSLKVIFEEFRAQSQHRRELERLVISNRVESERRGQYIAGTLGGIGLIGSLVVAGLGQGWAGFGIALTSIGSLVSLFLYGQKSQKRDLKEKEAVREKINQGTPIDEVEGEEQDT